MDAESAEMERLKDKLGKADQIVRGFGKMVAKRDAEIERLKEENAHLVWRDSDKNRLITELCQVMEEEFGTLDHRPALKDKHPWTLIARAREATR